MSSYHSERRPHGQSAKTQEFQENPLAIFRGGSEVALVEGTGPKPHLLSLRSNYTVLGASGGQFSSSPKTLKATLAAMVNHGATITLFTDAGDRQKPMVMRKWMANAELLQSWGYRVRVWEAGDADIDELPEISLQYLEFVSVSAFFGEVTQRELEDKEISREHWEFLQWVRRTYDRAAYRHARDLGYLPDNPQLHSAQSLAITPPGFWDENQAFVTRSLHRSVFRCTPETVPAVAHWEAMGRPRLFFESEPAQCLLRMVELGHRSILADDGTGAGKSRISGEIMQTWDAGSHDPEKEKAYYFATDYKNPSTKSLEAIAETPTGGAMDFDRGACD